MICLFLAFSVQERHRHSAARSGRAARVVRVCSTVRGIKAERAGSVQTRGEATVACCYITDDYKQDSAILLREVGQTLSQGPRVRVKSPWQEAPAYQQDQALNSLWRPSKILSNTVYSLTLSL